MKDSLAVRALTLTFAIGAGAYLVVRASSGCSKTTTATPEAPATNAANAPGSASPSAPAASAPPVASPTFMPATKSGEIYHPAPQPQKAP